MTAAPAHKGCYAAFQMVMVFFKVFNLNTTKKEHAQSSRVSRFNREKVT